MVETAKALIADGKTELASRHLGRYLQSDPDHVEATALLAGIQADTAANRMQILAAARLFNKVLVREPDGPQSQAARRRLAELYIAYSDQVIDIPASELKGEAEIGPRYRSAEAIVREMIGRGDDGAAAHRILGSALEGMAGRTTRRPYAPPPSTRRPGTSHPKDVEIGVRLARLLRDRMGDDAAGDAAMARLLKIRPDAEARLARSIFPPQPPAGGRGPGRRRDRGSAEAGPGRPARAPGRGPRRDGRNDTAAARRCLKALGSDGPFVLRFLRGMVDLAESHPFDAIESPRKDLVMTGGTDADLTWWLAFIDLQLNRVAEARPLMIQYRRVGGDAGDAPYHFLLGILDFQLSRYAPALEKLEYAENHRLVASLRDKLELWMGKCYGRSAGSPRRWRPTAGPAG